MGFDVLLTVLVRVLALGAGLVTTVITARYLAPEGRGIYFLVITAGQMVVQFASLGMVSSNTYLVANNGSLAPALLTNGVWVGVVGSAVLTVLSVYIFDFGATSPALVLFFVFAVGFLSLVFLIATNLLVGLGRIQAFNKHFISYYALLAISYVVVALLGGGLQYFLLASVLTLTASVTALAAAVVTGQPVPLAFDPKVFRDGLAYAARAYATTLLGYLILRTVVIVMSHELGAAEVGIFSVASQMGDALAIVPQSFALVLFPRLVRANAKGSMWGRLPSDLATVVVIMGALCAATYLLAEPLVATLFGPEYRGAVPVMRALLPSVFLLSLINIASQYFAADRLPAFVIGFWLAGVAATIASAMLLIPTHGAIGGALAIGVGHLVVALLMVPASFWIRRASSFNPVRTG